MQKIIKLMIILGTRPEAIKLCPLINELQKHEDSIKTFVCVTAQHREMLDQVLSIFEVKTDYDLNLMKSDQTLFHITTNILIKLDEIFKKEEIDMVIVQGDTTTTFAASLAAFYHKIQVGHVEAGLRTGNKYSPFPEEINRKLTTVLSDLHFAPTSYNKINLINEGISDDRIFVTGNTVIDALLWVRNKIRKDNMVFPEFNDIDFNKKVILVTGHRGESFGKGFINLCHALKIIAQNNTDIVVVYPVHLNPNVRKPVNEILSGISNIKLMEPLDYEPFVELIDKSYIVITDSGGIQEEAPSLGKPVLVTRETTERPEALDTGSVKLVGTDLDKIVNETQLLLDNTDIYNSLCIVQNPYGDGKASIRIVEAIKTYFKDSIGKL